MRLIDGKCGPRMFFPTEKKRINLPEISGKLTDIPKTYARAGQANGSAKNKIFDLDKGKIR